MALAAMGLAGSAGCAAIAGLEPLSLHDEGDASDARVGDADADVDDTSRSDAPPADSGGVDDGDGTSVLEGGACDGAANCERIVFVTSLMPFADFGGIAAADGYCNTAAQGSGNARLMGTTFLAWLSTSATDPASRFVHGTSGYVLPDMDHTLVANDWADLTDGTLKHPIDTKENGMAAAFMFRVWTGTKTNGTADSDTHCLNWTQPDGGGGATSSTGSTTSVTSWTGVGDTCEGTAHLYCFEK